MSDTKYKVLCVDDEARVLEALKRHLRERFEVLTATSGAAALQLLSQHKDVALVVSDMRMPEMDGATLLRHARAARPSAVRVLLTGQADMAAAIKAINEGQIFRFLTKPCAPDQFMSVMEEAVRQHELIVAERVLLQRTLVGTIKALSEVMALVSPAAMGRAQRLKRRVSALATALTLEERWPVEIAALLSHLGHVSLPDALTYKHYRGRELETEERARLQDATRAANRLIGHVPRLEPVCALLTALSGSEEGDSAMAAESTELQILRIAMDAERLESQGLGSDALLETLQAAGEYSPRMLAALAETLARRPGPLARAEVPVCALTMGMILDEDIRTTRDVLIAPRGCEVTPSFIEHIRHFVLQLRKPAVAVLTDSTLLAEEQEAVTATVAGGSG